MRRVYWLLLKLYPRRYRVEFAEEMLAVFTQMAEERKAQGWRSRAEFFANECAGLLGGAVREIRGRVSLAAPLGGLAGAAVLHATFYTATLRIIGETTAAVERSAARADDEAKLLLLVTVSVVWLLFSLLVSMRLVRRCR